MKIFGTILSVLSVILIGVIITSSSADKISIPEFTYPEHLLHGTVLRIINLHELKIGETDSVKESMEFFLATDAKLMYKLVKSGNLSDGLSKQIYRQLRLLSVMSEKFPVEEWSEDQELLEVFKIVQENDPAHTGKLRCFDWGKPMWVGKEKCT